MFLAEVALGAASPLADEEIIEPAADGTADEGDDASGPGFRNFGAHFHGDAFHDARHYAADGFFFQNVAAQIDARGARCGDPERGDFLIGGIFKAVNQAKFLQKTKNYRRKNAQTGNDGNT